MASMPLPQRLLMGPGPSNPYPEVAAASAAPLLGHLDPAFLVELDEAMARLRSIFATNNPLTFPISATGSAGMEAAFVNVLEPGDVVVVGINGLFGQRMAEVASRHGAEVVAVEAAWGEPIDPEALLGAHPNPKVLAIVHAETSTGVRNEVAALGAAKGDALLLVDTVTSLAGCPVEVDAWGVDLAYSGTQKCLGVPPGLAPFTASPRAVEAFVARPSSWYLDLGLVAAYVSGDGSGGRSYHHTAPTGQVVALNAALGAILAEGLEAGFARHEEAGRRLQAGLEAMELELLVDAPHRLAQLTTVRVPDGVDEAAVRTQLRDRYGIEIGAGVGPLAGRVWRIGCMGHTARLANVEALLGALAEVLGR